MGLEKHKSLLWRIMPLFVASFLLFSTLSVWASPVPPYRPDWWDNADAQVFIENLGPGLSGSGTAAGTKGYTYNWLTLTMPEIEDQDVVAIRDYLTLWLDNDENQNMTKLFWVAAHFYNWPGSLEELDSEEPVITGYYEDGEFQVISPEDNDVAVSGNWVFWEPSMFPQPDRETLVMQIGGEQFSMDYVEMGTYCVPIPSTLLLLGGGLVGMFVLRRKKFKRLET